jgi:hypothetical protein
MLKEWQMLLVLVLVLGIGVTDGKV